MDLKFAILVSLFVFVVVVVVVVGGEDDKMCIRHEKATY